MTDALFEVRRRRTRSRPTSASSGSPTPQSGSPKCSRIAWNHSYSRRRLGWHWHWHWLGVPRLATPGHSCRTKSSCKTFRVSTKISDTNPPMSSNSASTPRTSDDEPLVKSNPLAQTSALKSTSRISHLSSRADRGDASSTTTSRLHNWVTHRSAGRSFTRARLQRTVPI